MKKGDKIPVAISGAQVGYALVTELGNGTVTLIIPAQKVVMGMRVELDTAPPPQESPESSTLITGVVRGETITPEGPAPVEQPVQPLTTTVETGAVEIESTPAPQTQAAPAVAPQKPEPVQRNVGSKWETNAGPPPDWDDD